VNDKENKNKLNEIKNHKIKKEEINENDNSKIKNEKQTDKVNKFSLTNNLFSKIFETNNNIDLK